MIAGDECGDFTLIFGAWHEHIGEDYSSLPQGALDVWMAQTASWQRCWRREAHR